jgi:CRISPR-associated protein Cas2
MAVKTCRLICYDVRDERRWRKVEQIVKGYGERVQYSIFRCWLTNQQYEALLWRLELVMAPEDSLLVVPIPENVANQVVAKNLMTNWHREEAPFLFY